VGRPEQKKHRIIELSTGYVEARAAAASFIYPSLWRSYSSPSCRTIRLRPLRGKSGGLVSDSITVLVVEDETLAHLFLEEILVESGFAVAINRRRQNSDGVA
jgi:hypothetical protein